MKGDQKKTKYLGDNYRQFPTRKRLDVGNGKKPV